MFAMDSVVKNILLTCWAARPDVRKCVEGAEGVKMLSKAHATLRVTWNKVHRAFRFHTKTITRAIIIGCKGF